MGISLAIGLAIASAVTGGVAQIQANKRAETQAENEARIAEFNSKVAAQQAEEEQAAAAERALAQAKEGKRFKARQRAIAGVAGVETRGSILAVLEETAVDLELDRLNILREGALRAGQSRSQSLSFQLSADAAKSRASSIGRGSVLTNVSVGLGIAGAAAPAFRGIGGIGGGIKTSTIPNIRDIPGRRIG